MEWILPSFGISLACGPVSALVELTPHLRTPPESQELGLLHGGGHRGISFLQAIFIILQGH